MPIGSVDFISTAPWNDPMNPWPAYAELLLSGTVTLSDDGNVISFSRILTLNVMNPTPGAAGGPVGYRVAYVNPDSASTSAMTVRFLPAPSRWIISILDYPAGGGRGGGYNATKRTEMRDVPYIYNADDFAGWVVGIGSGGPVTMVPVTTSLNPWEFRRRRLLEIV